MLTKFGKFLRVLRMNRNELLKDMAEKLNISCSYLSAIETGYRDIPRFFVYDLIKKYDLSEQEYFEMQSIVLECTKKIDIILFNATTLQKKAVFSFVRNFEKMNDSIIEEFLLFMIKNGFSNDLF